MPTRSRKGFGGFTLVELLITVAVSAIALVLAVPTWNTIVEKREVSAAAEGIASLLQLAQGEAVKRNEEVMVAWFSPGSHGNSWCIGASVAPKATPCDCTVTDQTANNFCSIGASAANQGDGAPYRLVQTDFVAANSELLHANPTQSRFSFDPIRGVMDGFASSAHQSEILDGDWLFYLHSNSGSGNTRNYELQIRVNITGRVTICTDDDRKALIGGYPAC